ncbi:MAG TPA: hypothetical protein VN636_18730 [Acidimicrobiia bacterium]|nr:hypothetical protein [Acidimicrobiia bacterium]
MATIAPEALPQVSHPLEEDDEPRALWERLVGWAIVAVCTWLVFCILNPGMQVGPHHFRFDLFPTDWRWQFGDLFRSTTTNGGDMGAHVWWPWFLEHNWFPKLRLSGWAPDWYAGFPAGQYYFPVPALMVAALDQVPFISYDVAFKLVTVSGPLMLPAAAYVFAKGLRAPWPAPPAFAIAAFGTLVQTRSDWQIYGGNIASTLAGEFSFTIALAFALFGLGAFAYTLDTGRRRWLPAVLIALAIMSHIVVAIFIIIAAGLIWLTRRPWRTWAIAIPVGLVSLSLSAVWLLPLLWQQAYTQSMRYTKLIPRGNTKIPHWLIPIGPVRHTLEGIWNALGRPPIDPNNSPHHYSPTLWLPGWIWLLAAVAIVAAGWYRRRSTLVLLVLALVIGVMFIEWPEHAIWNTRFLPFWVLTWGLIAAMGATEICRLVAGAVRWAYRWIRDGDLQDARARAWAEIATADPEADVSPEARNAAAWALAERRFDQGPEGWEPPADLAPDLIEKRSRRIGRVTMTAAVVLIAFLPPAIKIGGHGLKMPGVLTGAIARGWEARNHNPAIAIHGWAAWNYSGYEAKSTWPQYHTVMTDMEQVADQYGPGRALWEPSSGDPDAINSYGTSLALMLLPYWTHGKIDSMEGIYFESSATTSYHFITVSECAEHPSNPVRGLVYGTPEKDFDLCVRHLQMLGVRYLMLWTPQAQALAKTSDQLTLVKDIPGEIPGTQLKGWKVYEVANSDLVVGMSQEPVIAKTHAGSYSKCWNQPWGDSTTPEPQLGSWECTTAQWWQNRATLGVAYAQTGPGSWMHVDGRNLASVQPRTIDPVTVSNVHRNVDTISFDVSQVGKPVEVKESYFPNWHVSGAKGPYRLAPNLMVVVPTSTHVTLSYGLTTADWLGRILTVAGLVGLVLLALWTGATRFASGADGTRNGGDDGPSNGSAPEGSRDGVPGSGDEPGEPEERGEHGEPPDRREPAPALP